MADQIISTADLRHIYNGLDTVISGINVVNDNVNVVNNNVDYISSTVNAVDSNVKIIYDKVDLLAESFNDFVMEQLRANRLHDAEIRLVNIRQELDKKYGHYDIVRRTTTGILQADDLGIIRKETINTATEELMLAAPNYWLAPCLVALAAWISDQRELAERALAEGFRRSNEKTSLLFALICRRAGRKQASLKWTQKYLEGQDPMSLDRKAVVILDAYTSGLLGTDSDGLISKQLEGWLNTLAMQQGFIEQQIAQWSDAINAKRRPIAINNYQYLQKYSKTWARLQRVMEGAYLHNEILEYFMDIFNKESSSDHVKEQLDEILDGLVSDFDDEELPLRKKEQFEQFVVDFKGDEQRAKNSMALEESAFETHKDFTQLLTDAAMRPENSHSNVSTQKFAVALSREWIMQAYNDITAYNRMDVPAEIEINVDTFNDKTTDGSNEKELLKKFNDQVNMEFKNAMNGVGLTGFEQFCLVGGGIIGGVGLIMLPFLPPIGVIAVVAGIGMIINHFSKKKQVEKTKHALWQQFEGKLNAGITIIRSITAEVVDFRNEFKEKDSESEKVVNFLEEIHPDQYVQKLSSSTRKMNIHK